MGTLHHSPVIPSRKAHAVMKQPSASQQHEQEPSDRGGEETLNFQHKSHTQRVKYQIYSNWYQDGPNKYEGGFQGSNTETKSIQYTVYPPSNTCTEFSRICFKSDLRQLIRSKRIFACLLGLCINATVLAAFASPISKENVINSSSSIAKQDLRHTHGLLVHTLLTFSIKQNSKLLAGRKTLLALFH